MFEKVFFIFLTITVFVSISLLKKKTGKAYFDPVILSLVVLVGILSLLGYSVEEYEQGGEILLWFLPPGAMLFAYPMYLYRELLFQYFFPVFISTLLGILTHFSIIYFLSRFLGIHQEIFHSLILKSITNPIALKVVPLVAGIPSITVLSIFLTGAMGPILGPRLCKWLKLDEISYGVATGVTFHVFGTSALSVETHRVAKAFAGMSIGFCGFLTLIYIVVWWYLGGSHWQI